MADRIQLRRDTSANWESVNPTLAQGELGIETDTLEFKIGTGNTEWNDLIYPVGYRNIPAVADKTTAYTIQPRDVGKVVNVGSGGSIEIPDAVFGAGDAVLVFNNTASTVTITCSVTTAYVAGVNTDRDSVTLSSRGVCNILFISGTVCVLTGNIT